MNPHREYWQPVWSCAWPPMFLPSHLSFHLYFPPQGSCRGPDHCLSSQGCWKKHIFVWNILINRQFSNIWPLYYKHFLTLGWSQKALALHWGNSQPMWTSRWRKAPASPSPHLGWFPLFWPDSIEGPPSGHRPNFPKLCPAGNQGCSSGQHQKHWHDLDVGQQKKQQ